MNPNLGYFLIVRKILEFFGLSVKAGAGPKPKILIATRVLKQKYYELKDHLGNVRATISDLRTMQNSLASATVESYNTYYPFGMLIPGTNRQGASGDNRYGFNGKEMDNDMRGGTGATYDYGFRIYDSRIAKFLSVDPLTKEYPWYTPYQFAGNVPISCIDIDGLEEYAVIISYDKSGTIFRVGTVFDNELEPIINGHWVIHKFFDSPINVEFQRSTIGSGDLNDSYLLHYSEPFDLKKFARPLAMNFGLSLVGEFNGISDAFRLIFGEEPLYKKGKADRTEAAFWLALEAAPLDEVADLVKLSLKGAKTYADFAKGAAEIWNKSALGEGGRGKIIEAILKKTVYKASKGYAHVGNLMNGFWPYFDFIKGTTAISVKTTMAKSGFNDIYDNIDNLANFVLNHATHDGKIINEVILDIRVPKGFDRSNLDGVMQYARKNGIKPLIIEF